MRSRWNAAVANLRLSFGVIVGAGTFALLVTPASAKPECPEALNQALRLIVVTVADAAAAPAIVETYERETSVTDWRPAGGLMTAVVGRKGIAWGAGFRDRAEPGEPLKQEGDLKSPMGIYALGPTFGFEASTYSGHLKLQKGRHVCVEEPRSRSYGRIVASKVVETGFKYDEMANEPLYRRGVVVDYPADAANKAGSCIFIHVWRKPGKGTAGCVALDEADVARLQDWSSAAPAAIAILDPAAKQKFDGCLP